MSSPLTQALENIEAMDPVLDAAEVLEELEAVRPDLCPDARWDIVERTRFVLAAWKALEAVGRGAHAAELCRQKLSRYDQPSQPEDLLPEGRAALFIRTEFLMGRVFYVRDAYAEAEACLDRAAQGAALIEGLSVAQCLWMKALAQAQRYQAGGAEDQELADRADASFEEALVESAERKDAVAQAYVRGLQAQLAAVQGDLELSLVRFLSSLRAYQARGSIPKQFRVSQKALIGGSRDLGLPAEVFTRTDGHTIAPERRAAFGTALIRFIEARERVVWPTPVLSRLLLLGQQLLGDAPAPWELPEAEEAQVRELERLLLRRRGLLGVSLKMDMEQRWGRSSPEEEKELAHRQKHISRELGSLDAALSQRVQQLRDEDPDSVKRWADLHIGMREAVLAREDLDAVTRGVAEAEKKSWQEVKQGHLEFVQENVHYINIHGRLYRESFGDITPCARFVRIA